MDSCCYEESKSAECSICFEAIDEFGLLCAFVLCPSPLLLASLVYGLFCLLIHSHSPLKTQTCTAGCDHAFCVECITKWRQSKVVEHEVSSSCPICRRNADFVLRSSRLLVGGEKELAMKRLIE